jgi:hypothetical protein
MPFMSRYDSTSDDVSGLSVLSEARRSPTNRFFRALVNDCVQALKSSGEAVCFTQEQKDAITERVSCRVSENNGAFILKRG